MTVTSEDELATMVPTQQSQITIAIDDNTSQKSTTDGPPGRRLSMTNIVQMAPQPHDAALMLLQPTSMGTSDLQLQIQTL